MKKLFTPLSWLLLTSIITIAAYAITFFFIGKTCPSAVIAGGTIFTAFMVLVRYAQPSRSGTFFLVAIIVSLVAVFISTITIQHLNAATITFAIIIGSVILGCLFLLKIAIDSRERAPGGQSKLQLITLILIQTILIGSGFYISNILLG